VGSRRDTPGFSIDTRELENQFTELSRAMKDLGKAFRLLALGIDFKRYSRFTYLTPQVVRDFLAPMAEPRFRYRESQKEITREESQFCVDFVIETAVALASFDYSVQGYLARYVREEP
jgi:hypothetical protein